MPKELKTQVDWDEVEETIHSFGLPRWDEEDLRRMVGASALKWLDADVDLGVHSTEDTFRFEKWSVPLIGTTDLRLRRNGSRIVDWKTAGKVDQEWVGRMMQSWQWRIYLYATGADEFSYRGVQRDGYVREAPLLKRYPGMDAAVENYLAASDKILETLKPLEVYPMKRPYACRAYNRPCPRINDCFDHDGGDRGLVVLDEHGMHYSTLDLLYLCPERFRREMRDKNRADDQREAEGSEETAFGTAFHVTQAKLYQKFVTAHDLTA